MESQSKYMGLNIMNVILINQGHIYMYLRDKVIGIYPVYNRYKVLEISSYSMTGETIRAV
jgi:hypothetical protein